jgi:hypothetical protein
LDCGLRSKSYGRGPERGIADGEEVIGTACKMPAKFPAAGFFSYLKTTLKSFALHLHYSAVSTSQNPRPSCDFA